MYLPLPCFLLFLYSPSQLESSFQVKVPLPSMRPCTKEPRYSPFGSVIFPSPWNMSCLKQPSQVEPSGNLQNPFPCFDPFRKSPLYSVPSFHFSSPTPLGRSFSHSPVQEQFSVSLTRVPLPSATLCRTWPSQQLPLLKMYLPSPCAKPWAKVPKQQDPSLKKSSPIPWGSLSFHSPLYMVSEDSMRKQERGYPFTLLEFLRSYLPSCFIFSFTYGLRFGYRLVSVYLEGDWGVFFWDLRVLRGGVVMGLELSQTWSGLLASLSQQADCPIFQNDYNSEEERMKSRSEQNQRMVGISLVWSKISQPMGSSFRKTMQMETEQMIPPMLLTTPAAMLISSAF